VYTGAVCKDWQTQYEWQGMTGIDTCKHVIGGFEGITVAKVLKYTTEQTG